MAVDWVALLMVLAHSGVIENYIQRVTELSQSTQRIPTTAELQEIVTELGIEPGEIQAAQQYSQDHYTRAQGYMRLGYWEDAITELQEAIALNPSQPDMLLCLGQAHLGRWRQFHVRQDAEQLHLRIRQCLSLQPDSEAALNLLAAFRKSQQQRSRLFATIGLFLGAVLVGSTGYIFLQGGFPFVIEEKARLERLEASLEEQTQQLEALRQTESQNRQRLNQALMNLRAEVNQQLPRQSAELKKLQREIKKLEADLKALKQRPPRSNPSLPSPER